jgi:hypothetical protein
VKHSRLPHFLSLVALVIAVLVMATLYANLGRELRRQRDILSGHQMQLEALQDVVKDSNELEAIKQQLAHTISIINEIVSDRIIWSEQLGNISRLAPDNVWFDKVKVSTKHIPKKVEVTDPKTGQVSIKEVRVPRLALSVTGYVIESDEGSMDVNPLLRATTAVDEQFTQEFTLQLPSVKDTDFEGFPVKKFELEFLRNEGEPS